MAKAEFFKSADFVAYVRLLAQLHELMRAGRDETAEGEALRDQMDLPGDGLSIAEVAAIKGIAADLYSLGGRPTVCAVSNSEESLRLRREAFAARDAGRFHEAFDRIRKCEPFLQPAHVAALRGTVWSAAGEPSIAASFFAWAAKEEPSNEIFAFYELDQLSKSDPAAALAIAKTIVADENESRAAVILKAAELVSASTRDMSLAEANPILNRLSALLERAAIQLQTDGAESLNRQLYAGLLGLAGICRYRLGDIIAAANLFDRGLRVHPASHGLLIARGILQYGRNSKQAIGDFQQAIALGAKNFWPLFYLAHYRLKRGDFVECLNACNQSLRFDESERLRANVFEWLAICQFATETAPLEEIRANFREARRLAPENERIRRNQQSFERAITRESLTDVVWESPDEAAIREIGASEYQPWSLAA